MVIIRWNFCITYIKTLFGFSNVLFLALNLYKATSENIVLNWTASFTTAHIDLLAELKAMPLSRDTMRIKTRKDELERKLRETDSAIKIFSRERVFIKVDE